jgi:branched-chain amino acid transport system ATP-binding protein
LVSNQVKGTKVSTFVVQGLIKRFGAHTAVDNVSFEIAEGEIVALIGPNGAGKSTTFNMLSGQLIADEGNITLDSQLLMGMSSSELYQLGIGRTFQIAEVFQSLTTLENIQMALISKDSSPYSIWSRAADFKKEEAMALLRQVGLEHLAGVCSYHLSYGDVKRLEIAMAIANHPKILLMDEPTAGMAPEERAEIMKLILNLMRERSQQKQLPLSVLFTEHSMDIVFGMADRVIVMAKGRVIANGTPNDIKNNALAKELYFGGRKIELPKSV